MNYQKKIISWSKKSNPKWLVLVRVILGLCLFIKGFVFIRNTSLLESYIISTSFIKNPVWITMLIPWIHLLGGSMIIAGLLTRFATSIQIPILLGAVIFVHAKRGIFTGESDLLFSVIILVLLIFFFFQGGGMLSLDNYFKKENRHKSFYGNT